MSNKRTATQITVTIPEGAPAGSILSIPVNGKAEPIKAKVPEGLGPGSQLVLTQWEGSDEWVPEAPPEPTPQPQSQAQPMSVVPGAVVGLDLNNDGTPDLIVAGPDLDQDGIPDALQQSIGNLVPVSVGGGMPGAPVQMVGQESPQQDPSLVPAGPVAYTVRLDTTAGVVDIIVRPDWAPHGARRFLELAASGDLDGLTFYRAVKGCLAQFGLPAKRQWQPLPDDPPTAVPFLLGAVCFAAVGKNSRKSTLFICIGDMSHCFGQSPWETPIGAVAEASLDVLDRIETIYGDIAECGGAGPNTSRINAEGDEYLNANFPLLTRINSAKPLDWPPTNEPISDSIPTMAPTSPTEPIATTSGGMPMEPGSVAGPTTPSANGSGPARMPSSAKQKATPEPSKGHGGDNSGTPIDVPVEIVPRAARTSRGDLTARGARGPALDVPVEVCASRPARRQTFGGIASGAKTARSTSIGGIVRIQASPQPCDSSLMMTPSQASSISLLSGGGLQPVNSMLNRSLNVSFEQQAHAQAQVLQQAHAQAHGQSLQMQAHGAHMSMLGMQPPPGQPFGAPTAPPLGTFGGPLGTSSLMEPLATSGSLAQPMGGGMLGPQSPQQPFSPGQLLPMSPLGFPQGACQSPCGGLAPPLGLGAWSQR